ncbi:hypothetical protein [Novosphingobium sp.]|uniref:hypothetical protein n=1 Tax=Novosphingobium sp. TaxID=1874826 RepID=UPI003D138383
MSKAPNAPDPTATAAAQTASNQQTASYNAALNRVDTTSPLGSSTYTVTGKDPTTGAPIYAQNIALSPGQQQLYDTQLNQNNQIASLGNALTGQIGNSIANPLTGSATSATNASNAYYNKEQAYLQPQQQEQSSDLAAKLASQGIVAGSDAYERAQGDLSRNQTFSNQQVMDQAVTQGQTAQQQAIQNQSAVINQPYNELASLRSGQAVQMPTFQSTAQSNANGTDVAGIINNAYAQQVAQSNSINQGLFSLGSAAISAIPTGGASLAAVA